MTTAKYAVLLATMLISLAGIGRAQSVKTLVKLPAFREPIALDTIAVWHDVAGSPAATFQSVARTLSDLKVPVALRDSIRGIIGNLRLRQSGAFAGDRPSNYLNCGTGATGENADEFRLTIAVAVFVDSIGVSQSRLGAALLASAEDVTGHSKEPVRCASNGRLETVIVERVRARVGELRDGRRETGDGRP
jgi:hypothetical protein